MQHEILLACAGYSGDIIVEKKGKDGIPCGFQVASEIDFLTLGEKETVNKIVQLGWYMKEIEDFTQRYSYENVPSSISISLWKKPKGRKKKVFDKEKKDEEKQRQRALSYSSRRLGYSLYIQALCSGLEEVVNEYRQDLTKLEQHLIADHSLPISSLIHHSLHKYKVLLPQLYHQVLEPVLSQGYVGMQVMDLLYDRSNSGEASIRHCNQKLLARCQKVFISQIISWCLPSVSSKGSSDFEDRSEQQRALDGNRHNEYDESFHFLHGSRKHNTKLSINDPYLEFFIRDARYIVSDCAVAASTSISNLDSKELELRLIIQNNHGLRTEIPNHQLWLDSRSTWKSKCSSQESYDDSDSNPYDEDDDDQDDNSYDKYTDDDDGEISEEGEITGEYNDDNDYFDEEDEAFLYRARKDSSSSYHTSSSSSSSSFSRENGVNNDFEHLWRYKYQVLYQYLPRHLIPTPSNAAKIFFIGRAIRILILSSRSSVVNSMITYAATSQLRNGLNEKEFESQELGVYVEKLLDLLPTDTERFQEKSIDPLKFECIINDLYQRISQKLFVLIVSKYRLRKHLSYIKALFLMTAGESYHVFINNSQHLFQRYPIGELQTEMDNLLTASFTSFLYSEISQDRLKSSKGLFGSSLSPSASPPNYLSIEKIAPRLTAEALQNVSIKIAASAFTKEQFNTSCKGLFFALGHGEICTLSTPEVKQRISSGSVSEGEIMSRVTTKNGLRIGGRGGVMWTKSSLFSGGAHGFLSTIRISKIDMNNTLFQEEDEDYFPLASSDRGHNNINTSNLENNNDQKGKDEINAYEDNINKNLSSETEEISPTFSFVLCSSNGKNNSHLNNTAQLHDYVLRDYNETDSNYYYILQTYSTIRVEITFVRHYLSNGKYSFPPRNNMMHRNGSSSTKMFVKVIHTQANRNVRNALNRQLTVENVLGSNSCIIDEFDAKQMKSFNQKRKSSHQYDLTVEVRGTSSIEAGFNGEGGIIRVYVNDPHRESRPLLEAKLPFSRQNIDINEKESISRINHGSGSQNMTAMKLGDVSPLNYCLALNGSQSIYLGLLGQNKGQCIFEVTEMCFEPHLDIFDEDIKLLYGGGEVRFNEDCEETIDLNGKNSSPHDNSTYLATPSIPSFNSNLSILHAYKLWLCGEKSLSLDYHLRDWPLQLILTHEVMGVYNNVFRFLFFIRKSNHALRNLWCDMVKSKALKDLYFTNSKVGKKGQSGMNDKDDYKKRKNKGEEEVVAMQLILKQIWTLRAKMSFILTSLYYYFQTDVIDTHWDHLMQNLKSCNHFDGISSLHNQFIQTLKHRCFLTKAHKGTHQCIQDLISLSLKFVLLIDHSLAFQEEDSREPSNAKHELSSIPKKKNNKRELQKSLNEGKFLQEITKLRHVSTLIPALEAKFNQKLMQLLQWTSTNESRELHIRIDVFKSKNSEDSSTNGFQRHFPN